MEGSDKRKTNEVIKRLNLEWKELKEGVEEVLKEIDAK